MKIKFKLFCESVDYEKANTYLTQEEAIKYIQENCKQWLNKPNYIVRSLGESSKTLPSFIEVNPKKYVRKSIDKVPNYYTLIIDNSDEWEGYPKRKNSLICSLISKRKIEDTRTLVKSYLIIPTDDSVWGVCNSYDIWESFNKIQDINYSAIDRFVKDLRTYANSYGIFINDDSYDKFKLDIENLEKIVKDKNSTNEENNTRFSKIYRAIKETDNFFQYMLELLNPIDNNFKLLKYNEIPILEFYKPLEVWTSDKCLMVKLKDFKKDDENVFDTIYNLFKK